MLQQLRDRLGTDRVSQDLGDLPTEEIPVQAVLAPGDIAELQ